MKKIFITGGTTGIGAMLAKLYLQEGHEVAVCGRDVLKFEQLKAEFSPTLHSRFKFYPVNVVEREKLISAIKDFAQGKLDILIANAGISMAQKSKVPNFARAREVIDTNIHGVLNSLEGGLEFMLPHQAGQIVVISSVAGYVGLPGAAAYSASKAAVFKLCESYAIDLKKQGIDITIIAPGFIDTPLTQKNPHSMPFLMSAEKGAQIIKRAIDQKKLLKVFPLPMMVLVYFLYFLPRTWYIRLMRLLNLDFTKKKAGLL